MGEIQPVAGVLLLIGGLVVLLASHGGFGYREGAPLAGSGTALLAWGSDARNSAAPQN